MARELAATLMKIEQVPDSPMFRQNTAAFIYYVPDGALSNAEGQSNYVRVQVLTIAQYYLTDGKVPGPMGTGHQSVVPYQAFPTADGFVVVAVFVENFWAPLCQVLGAPELVERYPDNASRVAARDELVPNLEARFLQQNTDEWVRELWAAGVPSGPVNTLDRVLSDPQVLHRRMVVSDGERRLIGNPIKTGTEGTFTPAPELGAHNGEYLG